MGLIADIIEGCTELLMGKEQYRLQALNKRTEAMKAMFPPAEKWNKSISEKWDELLSLAEDATSLVTTEDPGATEAMDKLEDWLNSDALAEAMKEWGVEETKKAYTTQLKGEVSEHNPGNKFQPKHMSNTKDMVFNEAKVKAFMEKFGLAEAEVIAIRLYTANDYKYINPAVANQKDHPERQLMNKEGKPVDWMDSAQNPSSANKRKELYEEGAMHAGVIMEAFKKLPKKEGKVYRGARMDEATFNSKFSVGSELPVEAFLSQSTSASKAEAFSRGNADTPENQTVSVVAEIDVHDARDISEMSVTKSENEWLLPPGGKLTVVRVEENSKRFPGTPPATAWKKVFMKQM